MLHPDICVKKSSIEGKGLFSKKRIPKGTILWRFKDDRVYTKNQRKKFSKKYKALLKKYGYEDEKNNLIYCTDNAKYWNHSCEPNVAGFNEEMDIAIKNINPGEEITYDAGFGRWTCLPIKRCNCGSINCRRTIKKEPENSRIILKLDSLVKKASKDLLNVKQPLLRKEISSKLKIKDESINFSF